MKDFQVLLTVARDEIQTLIDYTEMFEDNGEPEEIKPTLDEIRGDEFNHALIAILMAAQLMNIKIATDDISVNPNNIKVE